MKIEALTEKQEKQLIKFREHCLRIGLSTKPINKKKAKDCVRMIYKNYLNIDLKNYWFCDSPFQAQLIINILKNANFRKNLKFDLGANLGDNLWNNLWANLWIYLMMCFQYKLEKKLVTNLESNLKNLLLDNFVANLRDTLQANFHNSFGTNLGYNLWADLQISFDNNFTTLVMDTLRANLKATLRDTLWADLWNNLQANLEINFKDNLWTNLETNFRNLKFEPCHLWGSLDISWIGFYLFPVLFLGIRYDPKKERDLFNFYELAQNSFWVYTFQNLAIICDKPCKIYKKGIQLHNDKGMAVEFRDGWGIYVLNGVNVTKEIVETPASQLDPIILTKEPNAEVRREIVRKIGIERVVRKLNAKVIDKKDDMYELLEFELYGVKYQYLKMRNPSIPGVYHLEGVENCKTVEDALHFRKPTKLKAIPISENGEDWWQQGDVCIWRRNAKFVKPYPKVLT